MMVSIRSSKLGTHHSGAFSFSLMTAIVMAYEMDFQRIG